MVSPSDVLIFPKWTHVEAKFYAIAQIYSASRLVACKYYVKLFFLAIKYQVFDMVPPTKDNFS